MDNIVEGMSDAQREQWTLLGDARAMLEKEGVAEYDPDYNARLNRRLISNCHSKRRNLRRVLALLVVDAIRNRYWLLHPPTENFPNGYVHFRDYLLDCGIDDTSRYDLAKLGLAVEWLDASGYDTDKYLTEDMLPKFIEVTHRLLDVVGDVPPELPPPEDEVQEILDLVEYQRTREALRNAMRDPKKRYAHGAVQHLVDGSVVVLTLPEGQMDDLLRKMGGVVEWDLVVSANQAKTHVSLLVNAPFSY